MNIEVKCNKYYFKFFTTRSWSFSKQHRKGTTKATRKIENLYIMHLLRIFPFEGCIIPSAIFRDAMILERDKKLNNINIVTKQLQCRMREVNSNKEVIAQILVEYMIVNDWLVVILFFELSNRISSITSQVWNPVFL